MPDTAAPGELRPVLDERAWTGPTMSGRHWLHTLDAADVAEIEAAAAAAVARGQSLVDMSAADFPLPRLAARLAAWRREILHGQGLALIRGWPSERHSMAMSACAFRGLGAHLGEALSQNGKGHVLGHVANLGLDYADPSTRGYQTSAELRYHIDGGDIVGLLCVRPSRSGGLSKVAATAAVWNELLRRRPDLARELVRPFAFSRWGEVGAGQARSFEMPIFQFCGGRVMACYILSAIEKAQAFEEVARLTPVQREALDLVNAIADEPGIRLDMDFRPGDMQFLCNHAVLHSRTAYEDWPEPERRRHLLRLWLACDDGPALPPSYTSDFQRATAGGRPAGIRVPGVPLVAPLQPV